MNHIAKLFFSMSLAFNSIYFVNAQKNIILIVADDIGIDYSSGYNSAIELPPTPNLDKLASEGILFQNAWSNPLCSPTRATILTGRYGFRTGVGAPLENYDTGLSLNEFTLPKAISELAPVNYATACIGKWHLSTDANGNNENPNLVGFDHYSGNIQGALDDYYSWRKTTNNQTEKVTNYAISENINDAIQWIDDQTTPWFLWLAFNAAHTPFHLPPDSLHSYNLVEYTEDADPIPYFMAMIESMDTEIGRLMNYLTLNGIYENTDIIYIGDNGTLRNLRQLPFVKGHSKGTLYEGGIHVPLIISGPSVVSPGRTSGALVNLTDLYGTILSMTSATFNVSDFENIMDSKSLNPIVTNSSSNHRDWIYSEAFGSTDQNGVTIRNSKYHLLQPVDTVEELYDLTIDKYERNNLLENVLDVEAQSNYDELKSILDSLSLTTEIQENNFEKKSGYKSITQSENQLEIIVENSWIGCTITLYSILGQPIYTQKMTNQQLRIDLHKFGSQCIITTLNNGKESYSKKMLINF